jgi:hypothetical protein
MWRSAMVSLVILSFTLLVSPPGLARELTAKQINCSMAIAIA